MIGHAPSLRAFALRLGMVSVAAVALGATLTAALPVEARRSTSETAVIAFTRPDGIYVMWPGGGGVRPLWRGSAASLAWSADGRRLAFERPGGIWVIDADGSHLARVVSGASSPAWSPDGRSIAFTADPPRPNHAVWIVNLDGSGRRLLLSLGGIGEDLDAAVVALDWSPDGRKLVLAARAGYLEWIYTVNRDGTSLRRVSARGWAWDFDPEWSPDGRRIAYAGSPGTAIWEGSSEIYVLEPGRSRARLTRNGVADESPTWSPDGRRIAFVRHGDIYVMAANGERATRLTHTGVAEANLAWQPVAAR